MNPSLVVGMLATILIVVSTGLRATPYNNYALLADALVHGHVWIDWPGPAIDALLYNGKYYVIEAPLPAVLLLPAAALFGHDANQTILAAILGGVSVGAAWELASRLEVPQNWRLLLTGFFFVGTDVWWCAMYGDVWFVAHSSAVCFTMLALVELTGKRRGWLVALLGALAGFALLGALAQRPAFYAAFAVPQTPAMALLLFALIVPVFTFFATPIEAWWSRRQELAADDFAVRHADAANLMSALVKLYRDNASTLTPDRVHSAFYDSHPPAVERITRLRRLALP